MFDVWRQGGQGGQFSPPDVPFWDRTTIKVQLTGKSTLIVIILSQNEAVLRPKLRFQSSNILEMRRG